MSLSELKEKLLCGCTWEEEKDDNGEVISIRPVICKSCNKRLSLELSVDMLGHQVFDLAKKCDALEESIRLVKKVAPSYAAVTKIVDITERIEKLEARMTTPSSSSTSTSPPLTDAMMVTKKFIKPVIDIEDIVLEDEIQVMEEGEEEKQPRKSRAARRRERRALKKALSSTGP